MKNIKVTLVNPYMDSLLFDDNEPISHTVNGDTVSFTLTDRQRLLAQVFGVRMVYMTEDKP